MKRRTINVQIKALTFDIAAANVRLAEHRTLEREEGVKLPEIEQVIVDTIKDYQEAREIWRSMEASDD